MNIKNYVTTAIIGTSLWFSLNANAQDINVQNNDVRKYSSKDIFQPEQTANPTKNPAEIQRDAYMQILPLNPILSFKNMPGVEVTFTPGDTAIVDFGLIMRSRIKGHINDLMSDENTPLWLKDVLLGNVNKVQDLFLDETDTKDKFTLADYLSGVGVGLGYDFVKNEQDTTNFSLNGLGSHVYLRLPLTFGFFVEGRAYNHNNQPIRITSEEIINTRLSPKSQTTYNWVAIREAESQSNNMYSLGVGKLFGERDDWNHPFSLVFGFVKNSGFENFRTLDYEERAYDYQGKYIGDGTTTNAEMQAVDPLSNIPESTNNTNWNWYAGASTEVANGFELMGVVGNNGKNYSLTAIIKPVDLFHKKQ